MKNDLLLPLRRLHGKYHEWRIRRNENKAIVRYIRNPSSNVIIPVTPEHTNLGDHAIVLAQIEFLRKCGYSDDRIKEISTSEYKKFKDVLRKKVSRNSLIAQLGGGNMGNQWLNEEILHEDIVQNFPENKQIIFPQTIYFTPDNDGTKVSKQTIDVYNNKSNLTMVARETVSFELMKRLYPDTNVLLVPDIVLSANLEMFGVQNKERKDILLCFRSDAERIMDDDDFNRIYAELQKEHADIKRTDTHSNYDVAPKERLEAVKNKLEEFMAAKLVITDRLHGMVFAAITGTPCIAFSNYNYKVLGTYEWIKHLEYIKYAETTREAIEYIPMLLEMKNCKYDNTHLRPYFDKLVEVIKQNAQN